jgi:hypothetical protein
VTQRCGSWYLGLCVLLLGCSTRLVSQINAGAEKSSESPPSYSLNAKQLSIAQQIGPEVREPEKQKFVQFEVTKVSNPDKQPITFEVFFQAENHEKSFLGTFSLFPSDNPGKFIVPTKNRLRNGGSVVLSMVLPQGSQSANSINVEVRRFTFRER